jgi:hypothetical protein
MADKDTGIDLDTIAKLAKALSFIKGAQDPVTVAMKAAADSGKPADIKKAHAAFLKMKPGDRAAAMAMISG